MLSAFCLPSIHSFQYIYNAEKNPWLIEMASKSMIEKLNINWILNRWSSFRKPKEIRKGPTDLFESVMLLPLLFPSLWQFLQLIQNESITKQITPPIHIQIRAQNKNPNFQFEFKLQCSTYTPNHYKTANPPWHATDVLSSILGPHSLQQFRIFPNVIWRGAVVWPIWRACSGPCLQDWRIWIEGASASSTVTHLTCCENL